MGKATLDVTGNMLVGQGIDMIEEFQYLSVVLKETDNRFVKSSQLLVGLIASGIVRTAAIEHVATPVARRIFGNTLAIGEAVDQHLQRSLAVVFGICRQSILRMRRIDIILGGFQSIGTRLHRCFLMGKLRQLSETGQYITQIGIGQDILTQLQQVAQVVHSRWNTVDEVLFMLKVTSEAIGSEHLQRTEQHKQRQTCGKMARARHLYILLQRIIVFCYELTPQFEGIARRGLPQKRGHIIVERTTTATLEVYEIRVVIFVKHDISCLEIAIEETVTRF